MEESFSGEDQLEVSLVHRGKLAKTDAIFFAKVVGAGTAKVGLRFLRVVHEDNSYAEVGTQERLFLDNYFLLSITWKPERMAPMDSIDIETTAEGQNEGYEVVCHILDQAGIEETFEVEEPEEHLEVKEGGLPSHRRGPKRVEVQLVNRKDSHKKVTLVVTEYMGPKGSFTTHTLKGRAWVPGTNTLEYAIKTYHSDGWWIHTVTTFPSPSRSSSSFHGILDTKAWGRVEDFLSQLYAGEVEVLRRFRYDGDWEKNHGAGIRPPGHSMEGVPQTYHSSHWENYPSKPSTVFFRVSGDSIGQKAYLVQAEKEVKVPTAAPPSLEEFLETAEKKGMAGDASASPEASSAVSESSDVVPAGSVGSDEDDAPRSGGYRLPDHDPELDTDLGGEVFDLRDYPLGTRQVAPSHSAIERVLSRDPMSLHLDLGGRRRKRTLH